LTKIDPDSQHTLYQQVQAAITDMIEAQRLRPGHALPSEKELESIYGVSRITVRRALQELERSGKVVRSKGRSARVAEPIQAHARTRLDDDLVTMLDLVRDTVPEILRFEWILPDEETCELLELKSREPLLSVNRLRRSHGRPTLHTAALVPAEIGVRLERDKLAETTMTEQLSQLGILPAQVDQFMSAVPCSEEIAPFLEIAPGSPVFHLHRIVRDQSGKIIQSLVISFRGDSFTYHLAARLSEDADEIKVASLAIVRPTIKARRGKARK
jgi:GntR family transcriptional regulator